MWELKSQGKKMHGIFFSPSLQKVDGARKRPFFMFPILIFKLIFCHAFKGTKAACLLASGRYFFDGTRRRHICSKQLFI